MLAEAALYFETDDGELQTVHFVVQRGELVALMAAACSSHFALSLFYTLLHARLWTTALFVAAFFSHIHAFSLALGGAAQSSQVMATAATTTGRAQRLHEIARTFTLARDRWRHLTVVEAGTAAITPIEALGETTQTLLTERFQLVGHIG